MHIQRLVFLAAKDVDKRICYKLAEMAQRMQIPAQIGDVLTAVDIRPGRRDGTGKCDGHIDWSVAFGLSLSGRENVNRKENSI